MDNLLWLITDQGEWQPTDTITLFQFVGFFKDRDLPTLIESMAHEGCFLVYWILAGVLLIVI